MTIIGIDPGFKGAIASIRDGQILSIIDMPLTEPGLVGSKVTVDPKPIITFLREQEPTLAVLERVHAMPEQGVSSTFRFGEGFGLIQGIIHACGVRLLLPLPQVWKPIMNVTASKESSLNAARGLFPQSRYFDLKKNDGRAEALLLALFGLRSLGLSPYGGETINVRDIL